MEQSKSTYLFKNWEFNLHYKIVMTTFVAVWWHAIWSKCGNIYFFIGLQGFVLWVVGSSPICFPTFEEAINNSCPFYTNSQMKKVSIHKSPLAIQEWENNNTICFILPFFLIIESYLEIFRHKLLRKK